MVYKVFQSARTQSQSVIKALGHNGGTLFHASQSSYAAANNPLNNLTQRRRDTNATRPSSELVKAFSTQAASGSVAERVGSAAAPEGHLGDYLVAWQKQQLGGDREWKQFQFPKRIGSSGIPAESSKLSADTARTSNLAAAEHADDAAAEAIAIDNLSKEIRDLIATKHFEELERISVEGDGLEAVLAPEAQKASAGGSIQDRASSPGVSSTGPTFSQATSVEIDLYTERLSNLRETNNYGEIPAVFEAMLRDGLVPTATAYNALVSAAYHLPIQRHQVVPKVLDVYGDMLRRGVSPDAGTYTLVLEILAVRSLEILSMKKELAANRVRYAAFKDADKYLFPSLDTELEISVDEDVLAYTSKIFRTAAAGPETMVFAAETYRILLQAHAESGDVEQMIRVFSHMEKSKVTPAASSFVSMIKGFASSGDLVSAVECYNEYKNLAIKDNDGKYTLLERADAEVYAAVVEGYLGCDKRSGAENFMEKLQSSLAESSTSLQAVRDTTGQAVVKNHVSKREFRAALYTVQTMSLSSSMRDNVLSQICSSAADRGQTAIATEAFEALSAEARSDVVPAMVIMHVRNNNIDSARNVWTSITREPRLSKDLIGATAIYAAALIHNGAALEGLTQLRYSYDQVRANSSRANLGEAIDGALVYIATDVARRGTSLSGPAIMSFFRAMLENRGLIPQTTEHLLARLGPGSISELHTADLELALQIQGDLIRASTSDSLANARFATMLDSAFGKGTVFSSRTIETVEAILPKLVAERSDVVARWHKFTAQPPMASMPVYAPPKPAASDSFDPYSANVDHRGSLLIVDELDRQTGRVTHVLNDALSRFKNIRRAGRHPRYIAYAKLIGAAARDNRPTLIKDVFGMAQQDMPLQAQYPVVRQGWISILDSMVAAHLTIGNRSEALQYHQQMLEIGAAPSANTFGLYITTLKESAKTYDEATEAVRIFQRAKTEGVEPSSFLYNALIGKLGKARRIDDCLFYFSEMRQLGIRPTSVTYGTIVNALCRVSDERFAIELFDEMESMPNYKPRPAPYNSMMQFFLTTKRDSSKVLEYYSRMLGRGIQPTMHTYKLLIDTYATLEPVNLPAAEGVLDLIRATGQRPEPVHFAALIHAKGCAMHDMAGARAIFDQVLSDPSVQAHPCLYQALLESMVANHVPMHETRSLLSSMRGHRVQLTPYIANTLIHGWAAEGKLDEARKVFAEIGFDKREPSTYEAMTKAYLSVEARDDAQGVVREMLSRGYPAAVSGKVLELLGHAAAKSAPTVSSSSETVATA